MTRRSDESDCVIIICRLNLSSRACPTFAVVGEARNLFILNAHKSKFSQFTAYRSRFTGIAFTATL